MRTSIDLNADVGESFGRWELGDDLAILGLVSSANVACGFHAGDPTTLRATCAAAVANEVVVGAQVGYRDLAGFGRRFVDVSRADLAADVLYQLGALDGLMRAEGGQVAYLKPHGALYHAVHDHEEQAGGVVDALLAWDRPLGVLGFPGSLLLHLAREAGLPTYREGFPDRAYGPDGRLVPRSEPDAVLHDPDEVAERALHLGRDGWVLTSDGVEVDVEVASVCVHGDTPGAVAIARRVRDVLEEAELDVVAFLS